MELNKVEVKATIGGTECYIVSLKLSQYFNAHHTFECIVDYEDLDEKWMQSPQTVFALLGEDVTIEMKHKKGDGINLFAGIITQASYIGHHGGKNHIRISGHSPTIKLDGSKTMDSFMDMNLNAIVSEVVGTSGNGGSVTPQPKFTGTIDYICQYDETCFEFLNRLSWLYGEWFFYDGLDCYFGKKDGEEAEVTFESEMLTFDLSANLRPSKMKRYHYLVHDDMKTDNEAPDPPTSGYHTIAQGQSSSVYTSKAILPSSSFVLNDSELEAVAKAERNRATFAMLNISGTSQTSKVKIGGKITVKMPKKNSETPGQAVGTYLVTSVTHEYNLKGEYCNTFTAIPSDVENIPMHPVDFPKAYPQLALVKTNDDEKKLGRVKVEFQWQKDMGKTTNWIRVQTPDAGPNPDARKYKDKVPKNRGFVFIPEQDDIVMIGFEYGDPNRPYVAGSIFSEKASTGGQEDNKKKTITTRVDSSITFDDEKGSITIKDKQGSDSTITFDGDKNITVKADTSITLVSGGASIKLESAEDGIITVKAKTIKVEAGKTYTLDSGDVIKLASANTLDADSVTSSTLSSTTKTTVSSNAQVIVTAMGEVAVDGAIIKLN